ncbi:MAG: hypothetical protein VB049_08010 [Candidatus Pelethousia sp.]|nr:hypothetical protein [Candidatus Pelethousia sp.]
MMAINSFGIPNMILTVYVVILAFTLLFSLAFYILNSLGFYTLAKRRGIPHPGLSWLPIGGQDWILGSLADQYAYVAEGKRKHQRTLLLWLNIGMWVVMSVYMGVMISLTMKAVLGGDQDSFFLTFMMGFFSIYFLLMAVAIVYAVFLYIALHRVYKSCDPQNATLFLVLSIVVNVTQPFFVFFSRKKDLGMPPASPADDGPAQIESASESAS